MIKAILFDFDGTLADTAPGIVLTMQETFSKMGLEKPSEESIRQTIGLPLMESVKLLGNFDDETAALGVNIYRELFPNCELTHIKQFNGTAATVRALHGKGIRMAICTSRGKDSLERILTNFGLNDCFETKITASDNLPSKPAPDMVLALLERMNLQKDEAIVVGDTTFDIGMGNSAGCRTCAVTYGNHSREQLVSSNPTFIVDKIEDILSLV